MLKHTQKRPWAPGFFRQPFVTTLRDELPRQEIVLNTVNAQLKKILYSRHFLQNIRQLINNPIPNFMLRIIRMSAMLNQLEALINKTALSENHGVAEAASSNRLEGASC